MDVQIASSNPVKMDRRHLARVSGLALLGGALSHDLSPDASMALATRTSQATAFDFDRGNAPIEVIIPEAVKAIFSSISPVASDASLVMRITTVITNAWFDAIAPYNPSAVGVYSSLGRRPATEATDANRNVALFYSSLRVLSSLFPAHVADWRAMLESVGLDPDDTSTDTSTPVGLGNAAGYAVVEVREHDGMNQLGDEGDQRYNRMPYADYTGYEPINSPHTVVDPGRWQPQMVSPSPGVFRSQCFVTPQFGRTTPYSYASPAELTVPPPAKSMAGDPGYREQVDEVLEVSANLTDYQKMSAELWDNKIIGLGFSALFASQRYELSLEELVHYDFLTNMAAFDAAIAVWNLKYEYDAVRPFTAIREVYGDEPVTAWGGPGMGTVNDLPASQWKAYLQTADHPEYPSGSTALCAAHAEASRLYLGTDELGWSVPMAAGSSRIEPGVTPAEDMSVGPWETWTDLARECGLSRVWGGVHFLTGIAASEDLGTRIGSMAFTFVQRHLDGEAA